MRVLIVMLSLTIGCTTEVGGTTTKATRWLPGDLVEASGSRLKAIWWETDDGLRTLSRIHDTVLGLDCTFEPLGDGRWLCVPSGADSVVYADPACTEPRVRGIASANGDLILSHGAYAAARFYTACGTLSADGNTPRVERVFAVGDNGGLATYYERTDYGCVPESERGMLYDVTEVPLSSFVPGTRQRIHEQKPGVLDKSAIISADGFVLPHGMYDRDLDVPCDIGAFSSDIVECLPSSLAWVELYSDKTCTSQSIAVTDACDARYAYTPYYDVDHTVDAVAPLRTPVTHAYQWSLDKGCTPATPGPRERFYSVSISSSHPVPQLSIVRGTDPDTRLQQVYWTDPYGTIQHTGRLYDTQQYATCTMLDGVCVPDYHVLAWPSATAHEVSD